MTWVGSSASCFYVEARALDQQSWPLNALSGELRKWNSMQAFFQNDLPASGRLYSFSNTPNLATKMTNTYDLSVSVGPDSGHGLAGSSV